MHGEDPKEEGPHRDLKEPEGWRFSSFRKMRLGNEKFS